MLLPETKEREYRFKLALRMGLPIFFLILIFVSNTLINFYESIQPSFYFISILLLVFSIYFIFFLIYNGFEVRITENVTKTFTREYLHKYLQKKLKIHDKYTLILLSVDNLHAINKRFGLKNGDKVLYEVAQYIGTYLKNKNISNFPMGHIKGGDFLIGLEGDKEHFNTILELLCLKSTEFKVDDIEVSLSGAITDTSYSNNLDFMIENLFELQKENQMKKINGDREEINPNDLESYVINAINTKSVSIMIQNIYENNEISLKECFVKLKNSNGKILHPKSYMKAVNKLGLTAEYDYLVLEKSLLYCKDDEKVSISIIVSPSSLRNNSFLTKTKNLLDNNEEMKNRIIFMTTEMEYYSSIDRYNSILQSLRREGVKIAVDRLGSLHTSFLYMRDLDIDIVRFDTFYTKDLNNKKHKEMIEGLNNTAHILGLKTWVKMVENTEIKDYIKEINIDYLQGKELAELEKIHED